MVNYVIKIEDLQKICTDDKIILSVYCKDRCIERRICFDDIKKTILNGEIIKQYEDDKPFPSCLILGTSIKNKKLYVVASTDNEFIYIITAYFPDLLIWDADFKTKRR